MQRLKCLGNHSIMYSNIQFRSYAPLCYAFPNIAENKNGLTLTVNSQCG